MKKTCPSCNKEYSGSSIGLTGKGLVCHDCGIKYMKAQPMLKTCPTCDKQVYTYELIKNDQKSALPICDECLGRI